MWLGVRVAMAVNTLATASHKPYPVLRNQTHESREQATEWLRRATHTTTEDGACFNFSEGVRKYIRHIEGVVTKGANIVEDLHHLNAARDGPFYRLFHASTAGGRFLMEAKAHVDTSLKQAEATCSCTCSCPVTLTGVNHAVAVELAFSLEQPC